MATFLLNDKRCLWSPDHQSPWWSNLLLCASFCPDSLPFSLIWDFGCNGAGAVVAVNFLWIDLLFFFSQFPQLSTVLTLVDLLGVTSCKEGREIRLIWSETTFRYNLRYEHFHTQRFCLFLFLPNMPLNLLYIWHHTRCYL